MPGGVPGIQCNGALDAAPPVQMRGQVARAAVAHQVALNRAAKRAGAWQQMAQSCPKPCR